MVGDSVVGLYVVGFRDEGEVDGSAMCGDCVVGDRDDGDSEVGE